MGRPRHFLDLDGFETQTLRRILARAGELKRNRRDASRLLEGRTLAMIFEKPCTRTRVSFEVGIQQLGGDAVVLSEGDCQLGRGETMADTARVLSRYVDAIMIRTDRPRKLTELAEHATVPVINGLTDESHPCQIMADVMTYEEHRGTIGGRTVAWSGDANNVARSWVHAAVKFGFQLRLACPPALRPNGAAARVGRAPRAATSPITDRAGGGGGAGRPGGHRHLGLDGRRGGGEAAQPARALPRHRGADAPRQARRAVHALPAGASRPRGERRR